MFIKNSELLTILITILVLSPFLVAIYIEKYLAKKELIYRNIRFYKIKGVRIFLTDEIINDIIAHLKLHRYKHLDQDLRTYDFPFVPSYLTYRKHRRSEYYLIQNHISKEISERWQTDFEKFYHFDFSNTQLKAYIVDILFFYLTYHRLGKIEVLNSSGFGKITEYDIPHLDKNEVLKPVDRPLKFKSATKGSSYSETLNAFHFNCKWIRITTKDFTFSIYVDDIIRLNGTMYYLMITTKTRFYVFDSKKITILENYELINEKS